MPTYIPETCVVIASIRQDDAQHSNVDERLSSVPPREVKLLSSVYGETNRKFQENTIRSLKPLRDAINFAANKYGVPPEKLDPRHIDEVVANAYSLNKRHEGFYGWVAWTMKQLQVEGKNPFIFIFSEAFESSSVWELGKLHTLYRIEDTMDDCLRCETEEERNLRADVEAALKADSIFFSNERNSNDLHICSEMLVISTRPEHSSIVFWTVDKRFKDALEAVLPIIRNDFPTLGTIEIELVR